MPPIKLDPEIPELFIPVDPFTVIFCPGEVCIVELIFPIVVPAIGDHPDVPELPENPPYPLIPLGYLKSLLEIPKDFH